MYNAQYFIDKFTAIPDEQWCTDVFVDFNGQKCALGHCGRNRDIMQGKTVDSNPEEADALVKLFESIGHGVIFVNDACSGDLSIDELPTPKARILTTLERIKENENKRTVSHA